MGSNHHTEVVSLEERVQIVWSKVDNVVLFLWIPNVVVLKSTNLLTFMWITPEQVNNLLVVITHHVSKLNFERSLDFLNAFNICDRWTETSVAAEDSLLLISNYSC